MSDSSGPKFGFIILLLLIVTSIDFPGNPLRKAALAFLAGFQSSFGGTGGFLR